MFRKTLMVSLACFAVTVSGCSEQQNESASAEQSETPEVRLVEVPAGTALVVTLTTPVSTKTSETGDTFRGVLALPVSMDASTVLPANAQVSGRLAEVRHSNEEDGPRLSLELASVVGPTGERFDLDTGKLILVSEGSTEKDLEKVAAGGVTGGVIGGILGGTKGAAIGAAVGAGAGTVVALATRDKEIELPTGQKLEFRLADAVELPQIS